MIKHVGARHINVMSLAKPGLRIGTRAELLEARQDLIAKQGELLEVIDKGYRNPAQPSTMEIIQLARNGVGSANERVAANADPCEVGSLLVEFIGRRVVPVDALVGEHGLYGTPVGIVDDCVLVVVGTAARLGVRR